jgi:uncharacterized membrane protein
MNADRTARGVPPVKLRKNAKDERGAVAIIATVGLVLAMIAAGLAVDLGSLAQEARDNQKIADLAALDAVRALPGDPTTAAVESAKKNGIECPDDLEPLDGCGMEVKWDLGVAGVFQNLLPPTPLTTQVKVTVTSPHENDFPFVPSADSMSRAATATLGNAHGCFYPAICEQMPGVTEDSVSPLGTVRVGSSIASISSAESRILNLLLTRTVGGAYSLDAVGWQGLAAGNVSLSALRQNLGGSYAAGSPNAVLDADFKYRNILDATVLALAADGSPSSLEARNFLITLRNQVSATAGVTMKLRNLLDLVGNFGGGQDVADATINVKDIVTGGLVLADGDHLVSTDLTAADIPGLPGTGVTVKFGLIEAPQTKTGPPKDAMGAYRTTAETAQLRLLIESNVVVPLPILGNISLKIPYYMQLAGASASLDTLDCSAGAEVPAKVTIYGETEAASISLGTVTNAQLTSPMTTVVAAASAPIGSVSLNLLLTSVTVTVNATANAISSVPGHAGLIEFTPNADGVYDGVESKPVPGTTELKLPTAVNGNLSVVVTAGSLPLGVSLADIQSAIYAVVNPTLTPLNNLLVKPIQKALGVSIADAHVWAPPVQTCTPTSYNTDPTSTPGGPANPDGYLPSLID